MEIYLINGGLKLLFKDIELKYVCIMLGGVKVLFGQNNFW